MIYAARPNLTNGYVLLANGTKNESNGNTRDNGYTKEGLYLTSVTCPINTGKAPSYPSIVIL